MCELKDKYIRFDWAIKRLLRQKANFGVLEGFLTVFLGEAGKTYQLTVEYGDFHATATTTIPKTQKIDELTVERCAQSDTLYQISLRYNDDEAEQNYYQIFTRVGGRDVRQLQRHREYPCLSLGEG